MRCKNCGWPNDDEAKRCVKCNAPLTRPTVATGHGQPSRPVPPVVDRKEEVAHPEPPRQRGATSLTNEWSACPSCGYPVSRKLSRCPGCGTANKGYIDADGPAVAPGPATPPVTVKETPRENPVKVGTPLNDTGNRSAAAPSLTLQRESWINENRCHAPETLEGNRVTLNRANTDPANETIDPSAQATLVNENGQWYIENQSPAATTFVKVTRRMKLEDGDIIVMGNRSFTFHSKK